MLTSLGCLGLIITGFIAVAAMKDDDDTINYHSDETIYYNDTDDNYEQITYDYFTKLTIQEQEQYYKENLDLNYYLDDPQKGLTNDRYLNAKHAAEVARITGKKFDNRYKTY